MSETIAVLGLGHMGRPIAANLLKAGLAVRVWNRTRAKAEGLSGAVVADTPREAASEATLVLTMLADDAAVESVLFGDDGALAAMKPGTLHLAMSTLSVAMARKLVKLHRERGHAYVAAPVFGRPEAAAQAQLSIVCGGDPKDIDRCRPIFAALGRVVSELGEPPQANLAKLAGNFLIAAQIEALGEALVLGEKGGIEPNTLLKIFVETLFGSPVVKTYGAKVANTEFEPAGFAMPLGLKDVSLALEAGKELRVSLPLASLARDHFLVALARGRESWDWAGVSSVIRENAGLPPTRISGGG